MLLGLALILGLAPEPLAPTLAADFDGDGAEETATVAPARGEVRVTIRSAAGRRLAEGKAPAPDAEVVHVALSSGSVGSAGALLEVVAATDASECVSVWRYKDRTLSRLPLVAAGGGEIPACAAPGEWTYRWDSGAEGRPAVLVRERTEKVEDGPLRRREVFAFAGFRLDEDAQGSTAEINGVPIPPWHDAVLYSKGALETLYSRFDLSRMRAEARLVIETDRARGVFALRFSGPDGGVRAPVDSYAVRGATATLGARAGDRTVHATVVLAGEKDFPIEAQVDGLGTPFDQTYAPAGIWHGRSQRIFLSAADEIAVQDLTGTWLDGKGGQYAVAVEGGAPYSVRFGDAVFAIDMERAGTAADLLLVPAGTSGTAWGIALRGPNAIDRIPFSCPDGTGGTCRADGPAERLRRLGARVNVH